MKRLKEYAFDVKLQAVIRVRAGSQTEAERILCSLDAMDINHKEGRAIITEASVASLPQLFETND